MAPLSDIDRDLASDDPDFVEAVYELLGGFALAFVNPLVVVALFHGIGLGR